MANMILFMITQKKFHQITRQSLDGHMMVIPFMDRMDLLEMMVERFVD